MKTAISVPSDDFERFERAAARLGMNRSEFYRHAAQRLTDELEDESELTRIANAVITETGQPSEDGIFISEGERLLQEDTEW